MRFKQIKKRSAKGVQFQRMQDTMRAILKIERGEKCQLCGRHGVDLGVFHILPVSTHPRLRFNFENVLLSCWFPCHHSWHTNIYKAKEIEKRIMAILGKNYKDRLEIQNVTSPKLSVFYINILEAGLAAYLKDLNKGGK